jgi:DNA polymerase-1
MLLATLELCEPTHVIVSFDIGKTWRHESYPPYKAHREKMPDELKQQEALVTELVEALNLPVFTMSGYEADDVIGTLATKAAHSENNTAQALIMTHDMDSLQLVVDHTPFGGSVSVYKSGNGHKPAITFTEAEVKEKYGLTPHQIIDYKSLAGDASDNIPGVRGVGPKTATKLLQEFSTLDGVYEALATNQASIAKGVAAKLALYKDDAYVSQELATINTSLPIEVDWEAAAVSQYNYRLAAKTLHDFGFTSLVNKLPPDSFELLVRQHVV